MKDLNQVSHEDFEPCLNDLFAVKLEDETGLELELIQVKPLGKADPESKARRPFSLLFRGPMDSVLPQQMHQLENSKLGEMVLFLVPVGPDEDGMLYDASFN